MILKFYRRIRMIKRRVPSVAAASNYVQGETECGLSFIFIFFQLKVNVIMACLVGGGAYVHFSPLKYDSRIYS